MISGVTLDTTNHDDNFCRKKALALDVKRSQKLSCDSAIFFRNALTNVYNIALEPFVHGGTQRPSRPVLKQKNIFIYSKMPFKHTLRNTMHAAA